jgi:hypothetical protein
MASIAAAHNANGNIELVGLDAGGGAWRRTQNAGGTWGDWSPLNPKTLARVTAETGTDGRIQLVGVDNLGNIWHSVQTRPTRAPTRHGLCWTGNCALDPGIYPRWIGDQIRPRGDVGSWTGP